MVCERGLTAAGLWSCVTGRRAGSAGTPPPLGPETAAATVVYCGRPAACPGCGWSVAMETRMLLIKSIRSHEHHQLQCGSSVSQYLIEDLLQVWGAHAVRYVSVGRMAQKELPLCCQSRSDVLLAVDVLLTAVDHADVPCVTQSRFTEHFRSCAGPADCHHLTYFTVELTVSSSTPR